MARQLCPLRFQEFAEPSQQECIGESCKWFEKRDSSDSGPRSDAVDTETDVPESAIADLTAKVDELTAENAKLSSDELHWRNECKQLEGDLRGARTSRDHWRNVASRHGGKIKALKHELAQARKYGEIWPEFEGGGKVEIGDKVRWSPEPGIDGEITVREIKFTDGWGKVEAFVGNGANAVAYAPNEPIQRPPLKAKDGKPIEEGQMLYGADGRAWVVESIDQSEKYPIEGSCDGEYKQLKAKWLTHEKPWSLEWELERFGAMFEHETDDIAPLVANTAAEIREKIAKGEQQ